MTHYRFDPKHGRFTVRTFATGMLSFLGHSPTFNVHQFQGGIEFPDDLIAKMQVELNIGSGSLAVADGVSASDRREIEGRMWEHVLETDSFPGIEFLAAADTCERIAEGRYKIGLQGKLSLHGVSRAHHLDVDLGFFEDGIRLRGETGLHMSEFEIHPVTALGGTIRLKDEVVLSFDLAAKPEAS